MEREKLDFVENATVAIGLVEEDLTKPYVDTWGVPAIGGTGFFISGRHVITSYHALKSLYDVRKFLLSKYQKNTSLAVFQVDVNKAQSRIDLNCFKIEKSAYIAESIAVEGYVGPTNLDIAVCQCNNICENYLKIKKPSRLNLFDDIAMCGFPGKWQSMLLESHPYMGVRLSPVWQVGRIVGFMPLNDSPKPYAIQTDIIATGGSSGSPIVSSSDGEVVAIAQKSIHGNARVVKYPNIYEFVIDFPASDWFNPEFNYSLIEVGVIFGISNQILSNLGAAIGYLEKGTPSILEFVVTGMQREFPNRWRLKEPSVQAELKIMNESEH